MKKGSVNWDTLQNINIARKGTKRFIPTELWNVVAEYYKDPIIYDAVPDFDIQRVERYSSKALIDAMLDIPGMYLAGGSTVPGAPWNSVNDLDFFYYSPTRPLEIFEGLIRYAGRPVTESFQKARDEIEECGFRYIWSEMDADYLLFRGDTIPGPENGFQKLRLELIWRREYPWRECIRFFSLDYQQCMFFRPKSGGPTIRARTKLAVASHNRRTVSCVNTQKTTIPKVHAQEEKMSRKGFMLPAGVFKLFQLGFNYAITEMGEAAVRVSYSQKQETMMISHVLPDFCSPDEVLVKELPEVSAIEIREQTHLLKILSSSRSKFKHLFLADIALNGLWIKLARGEYTPSDVTRFMIDYIEDPYNKQ